MADRSRAAPLSVRLSQEDQEWLVKSARQQDVSVDDLAEQAVRHFRYWQEEGAETLKEALEIFEAEGSSANDDRQRQDSQPEYQLQSGHLHDLLRDERHRRWELESQLRDEHDLRLAYENQLRDEHKLRGQSRRLHDLLRDERHRRWELEGQLRDEHDLRLAYESHLRDEHKLRVQSRRLHDLLRDERHRRWELEGQLRDERNRRVECEKQLHSERGDHGRQARAAAADRDPPYGPTVAKLVALAISSESDSEAMAAFAKARSLHHQER